MEALTLWDAPPYQAHSATSRKASASIKGKAGSLRAQVLAVLKTEALTDEEIALRLNLAGNTARPRRVELLAAGLIEQNGIRKTASGRNASVWQAVKPTNIGLNA